ncbi:hypothetical protein ACFC96_35145 [Streptomyces sp. NPDC055955]|uniref:hypothetical protein n=1 Tax=Streptomyces sp. NPDC055955 TaxID=3345665 RepID=UPI0035DC7218
MAEGLSAPLFTDATLPGPWTACRNAQKIGQGLAAVIFSRFHHQEQGRDDRVEKRGKWHVDHADPAADSITEQRMPFHPLMASISRMNDADAPSPTRLRALVVFGQPEGFHSGLPPKAYISTVITSISRRGDNGGQ